MEFNEDWGEVWCWVGVLQNRSGHPESSCSTQSIRNCYFLTKKEVLQTDSGALFLHLQISIDWPVNHKLEKPSKIGVLIFPTYCHQASPSSHHSITQDGKPEVILDPSPLLSCSPSSGWMSCPIPVFFPYTETESWWAQRTAHISFLWMHVPMAVRMAVWMYVWMYWDSTF